jgi:hypothetical protein
LSIDRQTIQDASNGNLKSGLLVTKVVTNSLQMNFFLQSHRAIKGTARSAHYHVLLDDIKLGLKRSTELTMMLCYAFSRATTGVSYIAPAYIVSQPHIRSALEKHADLIHRLTDCANAAVPISAHGISTLRWSPSSKCPLRTMRTESASALPRKSSMRPRRHSQRPSLTTRKSGVRTTALSLSSPGAQCGLTRGILSSAGGMVCSGCKLKVWWKLDQIVSFSLVFFLVFFFSSVLAFVIVGFVLFLFRDRPASSHLVSWYPNSSLFTYFS